MATNQTLNSQFLLGVSDVLKQAEESLRNKALQYIDTEPVEYFKWQSVREECYNLRTKLEVRADSLDIAESNELARGTV